MPRHKKGKKKKNGKRNQFPKGSTAGQVMRISNRVPDTMVVSLIYPDSVMIRNNVGGVNCSWRYRMNSAYDPDPLLGTGAIPGFTEYAAFYTHYRVIKFGYRMTVLSNENFPLNFICAPSELDVGANYSNLDELPGYPYGKQRMLGNLGSEPVSMKWQITPSRLEGSSEPRTDNTFASQTTTNPIMIRFMNFGFTNSTTPLVSGVTISMSVRYIVQFYARGVINTFDNPSCYDPTDPYRILKYAASLQPPQTHTPKWAKRRVPSNPLYQQFNTQCDRANEFVEANHLDGESVDPLVAKFRRSNSSIGGLKQEKFCSELQAQKPATQITPITEEYVLQHMV